MDNLECGDCSEGAVRLVQVPDMIRYHRTAAANNTSILMARSRLESLADLNQMDEAIDSFSTALFAQRYFKQRFSEARDRVLEDLGASGNAVYALLDKNDWASVAQHLRNQFNV